MNNREKMFWLTRLVTDRELTASALKIAIVLAERSNPVQGCAWPSVGNLEQSTGLKRRAVQYGIRELENRGWLRVEQQRGRGHSNRYFAIIYGKNVQDVCALSDETKEDVHTSCTNSRPSERMAHTSCTISAVLIGVGGGEAASESEKGARDEREKAHATDDKMRTVDAPEILKNPLTENLSGYAAYLLDPNRRRHSPYRETFRDAEKRMEETSK